MYEDNEISRIFSFVRFNYENDNARDDDFIKGYADLWFKFQDKKHHDMLRVGANKIINEYGLDKI